jgi:DNA-binding Xre family transcriptional regulator
MSKSDLRKKAEIDPNTMTKLRRDEEVSLTILSKICKTLNADFGDIVEYVPDVEIWDLYDENRKLIGRNHVRGEQLPIDGYHLVVHVWIRNSKEEYLISQRSANRPTYPLIWECVGGSVVKGEDSLQGACGISYDEETQTLEEVKLVGNFVQYIRELLDMNDFMGEPCDRIMTGFNLTESIKELERAGFWVFVGIENRRLTGGVGNAENFPVL